jgi:hypothetical protein
MAKKLMEDSSHSRKWFRKSPSKRFSVIQPACLPIRWLITLRSMAPLVYSSEGQEIGDQLWKETMTELSFAEVDTIMKELST